jgi:hypothetical protein
MLGDVYSILGTSRGCTGKRHVAALDISDFHAAQDQDTCLNMHEIDVGVLRMYCFNRTSFGWLLA